MFTYDTLTKNKMDNAIRYSKDNDGNEFEVYPSKSIHWFNTAEERDAYIDSTKTDEEKLKAAQQKAEKNRNRAYQAEADPLFFKWQAGEGTQEDWQSKRQEIKQRYPYPDEA